MERVLRNAAGVREAALSAVQAAHKENPSERTRRLVEAQGKALEEIRSALDTGRLEGAARQAVEEARNRLLEDAGSFHRALASRKRADDLLKSAGLGLSNSRKGVPTEVFDKFHVLDALTRALAKRQT